MQPPATDIVIAHAPADATLASYYAIALRTQGARTTPYSPSESQLPQAIAAQVRNSRALVVLITDPESTWANNLVAAYRGLAASERWRRIAMIRRGDGQLSAELRGLPQVDGTGKPIEEVAAEVLALLTGAPMPAAITAYAPGFMQPEISAGPPQWPADHPIAQPLLDDTMLTRRALLIGGLGIASLGVLAFTTSAVLTRGFGLFAGAALPNTSATVPPLLFTSSGSTLYAVDLAKGSVRWGFTADALVRPAELAAQGLIYAISEQGTLYALQTSDGKPRWQASISSRPVKVRPVQVGGVLYIGSDDYNVYALNASDGSVIWKFQTGNAVEARPVVANGVLYVGSRDGNVYALRASDGKQIWRHSTGGAVASSAAVTSDAVFIGSDDSKLRKLRLSDGHLIWYFITGDRVSASPVVSNNMVYFASQDGGVYAVPVDGASRATWRFAAGGPVFSSPVVANSLIYFGSSDHRVYAIGTDGHKRWSYRTGAAVNGSLIVANDVVYAASDALYALDAAKGSLVWRFAATGKSGYISPGITQ